MYEVPTALFNFEGGGLVRNIHPKFYASRGYALDKLAAAFTPVIDNPPALIGICEAKEWHFHGGHVGLEAAGVLSHLLGCPYEIRTTWWERGPSAPALLYDPTRLRLAKLGDTHDSVWAEQRGIAEFALRADDTRRFHVKVTHFDFIDGDKRLAEAKRFDPMAALPYPALLMGDLNCTASGPLLPQRDWQSVPIRKRKHKGLKLPDGSWTADTRPMDHMIGEWVGGLDGSRVDGSGWHAVAELALGQQMDLKRAMMPTVNSGVDEDGALLIDWVLVNEIWLNCLLPDTYQVHVPPGTKLSDFPSDHRLVTVTLLL